ncbi:uncharacterized protein HD556DRAFT_1312733 [Suillus plorans]|uniref:Uncharacterized protein n=1 Tax=Suillus plorans TaxID=116603 RepID=A0A9P7DC68_9AGAM|nr:uncharacterized protein HD556DRAFT_1312733 [Suillus plorans]KAG1787407.1 hypothetical protein HD556DRAFT_1312733 [Suillus plorans]
MPYIRKFTRVTNQIPLNEFEVLALETHLDDWNSATGAVRKNVLMEVTEHVQPLAPHMHQWRLKQQKWLYLEWFYSNASGRKIICKDIRRGPVAMSSVTWKSSLKWVVKRMSQTDVRPMVFAASYRPFCVIPLVLIARAYLISSANVRGSRARFG